jgi:diaminohydroxyphosphoribosylaminopyrimidine deaminase/5-amino-6-(5-phosphoribosylamino)uracil reductase
MSAGKGASLDERWMRRALQLAARARGRTAPNPMVGAVLVQGDEPVGEGYHHRAGEPHAEVMALRAAGDRARGATIYVSLEPCCHHGRTPPCTDAILAAGVRRVVAATLDPFPKVSGGGIAALQAAGIDVSVGMLEAEARRLNEAFFKAVTHGLPFVTLKAAMTLDGKIATVTGHSRWVTGEAARRHVHRLRDQHDAILAGIGTIRTDDPLLTARLPRARDPLRVVVDARAELPLNSQIGSTLREVRTLVAATEAAPRERREALAAEGAEVLVLPAERGRVALRPLMEELVRRGVHSVLAEGGAEIHASLLAAGLVDKVILFIAPKLVGGRAAPGPIGGAGVARMEEAVPLREVRIRRLGVDFAVEGYVHGDC